MPDWNFALLRNRRNTLKYLNRCDSCLYSLVLLLFLLMIFLGTDGDAELRWWSSVIDGDTMIGVGVGTEETFGDCRALAQLLTTTGTFEFGPALEDRPSSPLLLFPASISHTIKLRKGYVALGHKQTEKTPQQTACDMLRPQLQPTQKGFCFCFIFPCVRYPTFQSTIPHHISYRLVLSALPGWCTKTVAPAMTARSLWRSDGQRTPIDVFMPRIPNLRPLPSRNKQGLRTHGKKPLNSF